MEFLKFVGKVALAILVVNTVASFLGLTSIVQNPAQALGLNKVLGGGSAA